MIIESGGPGKGVQLGDWLDGEVQPSQEPVSTEDMEDVFGKKRIGPDGEVPDDQA